MTNINKFSKGWSFDYAVFQVFVCLLVLWRDLTWFRLNVTHNACKSCKLPPTAAFIVLNSLPQEFLKMWHHDLSKKALQELRRDQLVKVPRAPMPLPPRAGGSTAATGAAAP